MDEVYADAADGAEPSTGPEPAALPEPTPRRRRWLWAAAVAGVVMITVVAAGVIAGRRVSSEHRPPAGVRHGIEQGLLAKDSTVLPDDDKREFLVTSSMLGQPFTVTIPKGMDARGGGAASENRGQFAAFMYDPRTVHDAIPVNFAVMVLDLRPIDLTDMVQHIREGERTASPDADYQILGAPVATTVGDRPAVQSDVTFKGSGGAQVRSRLVATVVGDRPVLFYFNATEAQFAAHEARFAQFLASARGS